ncbi:hypothetical protein [Streptomyces sp. SGAir0957]
MPIVSTLSWLPTCDVCGMDTDYAVYSRDAAVKYIEDCDWTLAPDGRVICDASDTAHYLARGWESPALLRPTGDAMRRTALKEAS